MSRPTPDPFEEGSKDLSASWQFPSWEGLGVGSWAAQRDGHVRSRPSHFRGCEPWAGKVG